MKFLVLIKATKDSEAGVHPEEKVIMETMRFNEEMVKAGVLLDAGGLYPSSQGKRIRVAGKSQQITDGPFACWRSLRIAEIWTGRSSAYHRPADPDPDRGPAAGAVSAGLMIRPPLRTGQCRNG